MATHDAPLRLIGCENSYFTGKIRGYLRWKGVPFEEVLSAVDVYKKLIMPRVGWSVIPVLVVPPAASATGAPLFIQDTSDIIDAVERMHPALPSVLPANKTMRVVAYLAELLADQWLLLPAMHYRWSFPENRKFLAREWSDMCPGSTLEERSKAALASMAAFANFAPGLGATPEMYPAIEASFERLLDLLEEHLQTHNYLFGDRPCLADFAMMGPFYAHLYRDPVPGHLMRCRSPSVSRWVERTMGFERAVNFSVGTDARLDRVGGHSSAGPGPGRGEFLAELPPTLVAVVGHMLSEYAPVLARTAEVFKEQGYVEEDRVPRAIAMIPFTLGGVTGKRTAMFFDLWMAGRMFDELRSAGAETEAWIERSFGEGGRTLLGLKQGFVPGGPLRVRRVENVLRKGTALPGSKYVAFAGKKKQNTAKL